MKQRGVGKCVASGAAHRTWGLGLVSVLVSACLFANLVCAQANDSLGPLNGHKVQQRKIVTEKSEISTDFGFMGQVTWSPDSKNFAVVQATKQSISIVVYDAKTKKVIHNLAPKKCGAYSGDHEALLEGDISFSPDGRYLAGGVGIITLWDTITWQPVRDILGPFARGSNTAGAVRSLTFSPDSKSLAILYKSVLWPESLRVDGLTGAAAIMKKRATDKSITDEAAVMVFDVETSERKFFVKEERATDSVNRFARMFSGNISYSQDGKYIIISSVGVIPHKHLTKEDDPTRRFTFLEFRDSSTGQILRKISDVHTMGINVSRFSPNGKFVATGTDTGSQRSTLNVFTNQWFVNINADPIRVWDVASGEKLMELGPLRGAVKMLAFSPDDKVLVSCQTDLKEKETIWIWDLSSGQLIERVSTPRSGHQFFSCALSPDGRTIAMPVQDKIYLVHIKQ